MARVKLRGFAAIDRRTAGAREVMAFRREITSALGGEAHLSPQRRKLVDMAARAALFLDHLDGWLTEQRTLVNKRSRSVIPALVQRQSIADHLARLLDKLGLDRLPERVQSLDDLVLGIEREKAAGATNSTDPLSPTLGRHRSRHRGHWRRRGSWVKALSSITILDAIRHPALFQPWFRPAEHWEAWVVFLAALFGLPMTEEQAATFRRHTARSTLPSVPAREAYLVVGRRGGKSRIAAVVAVFLACFRDYRGILAPGEKGTVMLLAADRQQARVLMRYVTGLLDNIPALASLVVGRTAESVSLSNRIVIEIHTASFRSVRGYTVVAAICDEIAFWQSEDSANPDTEILAALRPAMATVPGALLLCISSPYARRGALWEAHQDHYGRDGDPVLVWQAATLAMHPGLDHAVLQSAYARDPAAAEAEYGAQFRSDVEAFVTREMLDAVTVPGRRVLPPIPGVRYSGFTDPSGGSQDSMTAAIAHKERDRLVLDLVTERRPSFSPDAVVAEFAAMLKQYRITYVRGDRFGGEWPGERFRAHGVGFRLADQSKSEIYGAFLPLLTSSRVELLDHPTLINELLALDRRVARGGRESIDHPRGGRDDVANAVAGALVLANRSPIALVGVLAPDDRPCRTCGDRHAGVRCPFGAPTAAEIIQARWASW